MYVGFGNMPGTPDRGHRAAAGLGHADHAHGDHTLFLTDQHWEVLRALLASYAALPVERAFCHRFQPGQAGRRPSSAFLIALQISSPFLVYALIVNLLVGLANKLVPQIPVYFIATPFVLAGGFVILYLTIGELLRLFMMGFMGWLAAG